MYTVRPQISWLTGLTCVVSDIVCAMICTVTEVASGIVNASNKELIVCVW